MCGGRGACRRCRGVQICSLSEAIVGFLPPRLVFGVLRWERLRWRLLLLLLRDAALLLLRCGVSLGSRRIPSGHGRVGV